MKDSETIRLGPGPDRPIAHETPIGAMTSAAYHEAGHCAAMLAFNDPIALATVDGEAGSVTRPLYRSYRLDGRAGRIRALEYITTCLAGPEAERRIREPPPEAVATDRAMAVALGRRLCAGDWREARALVEDLEATARELVAAYWTVIERIAAALDARGALTGGEIRRLLGEPTP
jgi:hypothetical protein